MKNIFFSSLLFFSASVPAQQKDYAVQAVDYTKVTLNDKFWLPRIEINRKVTIPASLERCENTGRVKKFCDGG